MSETRLSEVDRLMSKLEVIKVAMRGKQEQSKDEYLTLAVDVSKLNEFEKSRFEITNLLNEVETFLINRDQLDKSKTDNRSTYDKMKIQVKIDERLNPIKQKLDNMKTSIDADRRKKRPIGHKEDIWKLLREKYDFLKVRDFTNPIGMGQWYVSE
jgi:hypothetical protein